MNPRPHLFSTPWPRILGYLTLLLLCVFSQLFYRERMLFADLPFQSFLLLNSGTYQIMVNRFGVVIVQTLPLIALKLGAGLELFLRLYSLAFPLFFLFVYWLMVRVLRHEWMGLVLVAVCTLIVYDSFYWAVSEQRQGLAVVLLYFAFLQRFAGLRKPLVLLIALAGIPVIVFYHPLLFIV